MIKKFLSILILFVFFTFMYVIFFFDINDYKKNLENIISKKANIELSINGNLDLDVGLNSKIQATKLTVKKNDILLLQSEVFRASVSISEIFNGIFDIKSISLINSKLYGINIDERIIQVYNALAGRRYPSNNSQYSSIELITARGYFQKEFLNIDNITIKTELLEGNGFGKINPTTESINISSNTFIRNDKKLIEKYNQFYPKYLIDTQLPMLFTGSYTNPIVDIKISEIVTQKLKDEIKNRAIESITDKIKDKIQSEINSKLPF